VTEWHGAVGGRAVLATALLFGWVLTGPPVLYIVDVATNGPQRHNVETIFVMAEIYVLWCAYFFLRSFSQRPISVWEHVACVAIGWFIWLSLGAATHNHLTTILRVPRPLDDSTYMLLFILYLPWIVAQYGVVMFLRPALRLDRLIPQG
jgi:hypothetical protein